MNALQNDDDMRGYECKENRERANCSQIYSHTRHWYSSLVVTIMMLGIVGWNRVCGWLVGLAASASSSSCGMTLLRVIYVRSNCCDLLVCYLWLLSSLFCCAVLRVEGLNVNQIPILISKSPHFLHSISSLPFSVCIWIRPSLSPHHFRIYCRYCRMMMTIQRARTNGKRDLLLLFENDVMWIWKA